MPVEPGSDALISPKLTDAWFLDGTDDVIKHRLLAEIEFNDKFAAWRIRMLSNDLSAATDWDAASHRLSWVELERLRHYEPELS